MKGGGRGGERYRVQCQRIKEEGGKDNSSTWGKGVTRRKGRKGVRKVVNDKDSYRTERKENWKVFCKEEVNSSREKKRKRKEGWLLRGR